MDISNYVKGKDLKHLIVSELKLGAKDLQEKFWADSGNGSFILDEIVQNGEFDANTNYWNAGNSATL